MKRLLLIVFIFDCEDHSQKFQLNDRTYNMWQEFIKSTKEFELVVFGKWNGETQNNGRRFGAENGNIGIIYNLAETINENRIAPPFVDFYNAD